MVCSTKSAGNPSSPANEEGASTLQATAPAAGLLASSELMRHLNVGLVALRACLDRAAITANAADCLASDEDRAFDRDDAANLFNIVHEMVCEAMSAACEIEEAVSHTRYVDPVEVSHG